MPLSWNEIKTRAVVFAKEWEDETSEDAEAKSFWDGFFNVFGLNRRRVASFEKPVRKGDNKQGFIDLLWKGIILVEHKSRGRDLDKAFVQAKEYFPGLKDSELPKYVLVSDFDRFRLYDVETDATVEFHLRELVQHVHLFGFIAGYEKRVYHDQDPVNIAAAEKMGKLHDQLKAVGYTGHSLERYLVRLLFCLFADDTSIFEKGIFWQYLDLHTKPDGSDLAMHLSSIFYTLNTPAEQRMTNLDENLSQFPYVNGRLFEEGLPPASFDSGMRELLLEACALDWGNISPAIFGSMFQAVMNPQERRNLGAHYTSEKNIQKVIKPLFLDELYTEFERSKGNRSRLNELHTKIARLRFLDPACGCGNFLIIAYRELRQLEIRLLRELNKSGQGWLNVADIIQVDVDQFAGIEYDEFPSMIAEVAMWLIDHQMNMQVSAEFGQYFVRLPLRKAARIKHGNALRLDWTALLPPAGEGQKQPAYDYIIGNPPFIGHQWRTPEQASDMALIWSDSSRAGRLDYVTCWFKKAADLMQTSPRTIAAFVSTNSITQGEQPAILWHDLSQMGVVIRFAHRTFKWSNEAKGNAAVHTVITGFSVAKPSTRRLFSYPNISGEPVEQAAQNINAYLVDASDVFLPSRGKPLSGLPEMYKGSQPTDGGFLVLSATERDELVTAEPAVAPYIKPYLGAEEFLNARPRYCLWLKGADLDLRHLPLLRARIEGVRAARLKSPTASVRAFAAFPTLFTQDRQPDTNYLAVPEVSSENRKYIPLGFLTPGTICSNKLQIIPKATLFMFGVMQSQMHMTWVSYVCGRMKSDFSYSPSVYNNFPWPQNATEKQVKVVEAAAQSILDVRAGFDRSLAELYAPINTPPDLVRAHQTLDKAVDLCFRPQAFTTELNRMEYLFGLYNQYAAPLLTAPKKSKK